MLRKKMLKLLCMTTVTTGLLVGTSIMSASACTTVVAGKNATVDGSTINARNEDMSTAWTKRFIVHPHKVNKEGDMYISKANGFTYPLPKESFKYTATPEWDTSDGDFEEAGINEYEVAVSSTESATANDKAQAADPLVENGIDEDSVNSIILPRVKTAREGVKLLGKIVEEKGATEAYGVIISDPNEVWYVETGSGHQWVAQRVPDDCYAVIPNILVIDKVNLEDTNNFMGSKNLIKFAEEKGLYDPKKDGEFSFKKAYGTDSKKDYKYNYPRTWLGQKILSPSVKQEIGRNDYKLFMKPDKKISVEDVAKVLRAHYEGTEYDCYGKYKNEYRTINAEHTMESHILQCRSNLPKGVGGVHWIALGVPETSVYVPFYSGITETPKAYQIGTNTPDYKSAYWTYRRTGVLTKPYYHDYLGRITKPILRAEEQMITKKLYETDNYVAELYNKDPKAAEEYMTKYCDRIANYCIEKTQDLNKKLIKETTKKTNVNHNKDL
ncbi:C69 family dipeptidase [Hathewaya limosa]|uniref:Dipeptidase n=1 Tax=Hathewaya limosa TaxID=1536 RepID=A0ABU0JNJ5_HATLI|nr:C69 family dipeptidase [Hathewaya limosa]MDQ0478633.1 dipeptidase [Hathewaya limosa]